MAETIQYGDWHFAVDFSTADHSISGDTIRLTRAERALLRVFTHQAHQVVRRERLLDAIAGPDRAISDRTVDFAINRLRRKLRDSATKPCYIATQYGEGYVWMAQRRTTQRSSAGAFIVVGPVGGLHCCGHLAESSWPFIHGLTRELDRATAQRHRVVLDPDCPTDDAYTGKPPQFAVNLHFVRPRHALLDCAVTLKHFRHGGILSVNRIRITPRAPGAPAGTAELARHLLADLRRRLVYAEATVPRPDIEPLTIRQYHASLLLAKSRPQWDKTVERLETRVTEHPEDDAAAAALSTTLHRMATAANQASAREYRAALHDTPDDPGSQLLLALTLRAQYTLAGHELLAGPARHNCARDEAEIETLVMAALPRLQSNDLFALEAAKLLYFTNKAHRPLALDLVDRALSTSTTLGTTFTIAGQLYACEARIDEALAFYDQALEFAPEATDFRLYVQTLQCLALGAVADDRKAAEIATRMYHSRPTSRLPLCLYFAATEGFDLAPTLDALLDRLNMARARGHLRYLHYLIVRHFRNSTHRRNLLRRPVGLLVARFGPACIPDEVRVDMPAERHSGTGSNPAASRYAL